MDDPIAFDNDLGVGELFGPSYPFWRDNGAAEILRELLNEIARTFKRLFEEGRILSEELAAHEKDEMYFHCLSMYGSTPDGGKDPRENFWNLVDRVERFARAAIVMAAIDLEASINEFCFYNLGEVTAEAIESLSLAGKLEVIHKVLGLPDFKGTSQYAAVRSLVRWRNAFVHGKCTDMPTHSIKENHTVLPKAFPDPIDEALEYIGHYLVVFTHLIKISLHEYSKYKDLYSTFLEKQLRTVEEQLKRVRGLELEILDLGGGPN